MVHLYIHIDDGFSHSIRHSIIFFKTGAQSGGVVTFEPAHPSPSQQSPPSLRGVRSRVVNAKRTTLSRRLISRIEKDNCDLLRGRIVSKGCYIDNDRRLVRGFFGHTRFATSSVASFEGTHPHSWSERREYRVYSFGVGNKQHRTKPAPSSVGVENYVTHNGDFEFFRVDGRYHDVAAVQRWLEILLGSPMPASVDSAAIAGVMDLLRTRGSFCLSARYALCLLGEGAKVEAEPTRGYLTVEEYEVIARYFEDALEELLLRDDVSARDCSSREMRARLSSTVVTRLREQLNKVVSTGGTNSSAVRRSRKESCEARAMEKLSTWIPCADEEGALPKFVKDTIDAFFDNDLLHSMRLFLENAKGSFGLCVVSTLDAWRQVCFAAKGQTLSVAFYPKKGLICYGSEQAAVKAGLNYDNPGGNLVSASNEEADNAVRLDLDDLGGEICLLDWSGSEPSVSQPNRNLPVFKLMNGSVSVVMLHQSKMFKEYTDISKRMTLLENNEFIKPLLNDVPDPVLQDIRDIPKICSRIQEDWHDVGLNRMTAWNLANCIRSRLKAHVDGRIDCHGSQVDILVTGCEVSLWVAEQFVSDLQKSFPRLFIKAVSSNKLLGLFGQELAMPCTGFPYSQKTLDMKDPIIIIVSHSGGTVSCSVLSGFGCLIFHLKL